MPPDQDTTSLETQLEALLQPAIEGLSVQLKTYLDSVVLPIRTKLEVLEQKTITTEEPKSQAPADSILEARVKELERNLEQARQDQERRDKEASAMRFDKALSDLLDGTEGIQHKHLVTELLANRYKAEAVEKSGSWIVPSGKSLQDLTKEFFSGNEGQLFLASKHQDGTGTPKSEKHYPGSTKRSTADLLKEAFL